MITSIFLSGCGDTSQQDIDSLGELIEGFQLANDRGSKQLANGTKQLGYQFILEEYEEQLKLIKEHRSDKEYSGDIKSNLDIMEEKLTVGIKVYKGWIEAGYDGSKKPAPDEVKVSNSFAIGLTEAETALAILAGK